MKTFLQRIPRRGIGSGFVLVLLVASSLPPAGAAELSDAEKLKLILEGKNEFTRGQRMKDFEPEGVIDAVGRLVSVDGKVYFKTASQSYIPQGRRFPYPELFFELHLSEDYAYRPLIEQGVVKGRRIRHDGPIRIKGNWAYERPYHIFGVVWIDEVEKVTASPEGDWTSFGKSSGKKSTSVIDIEAAPKGASAGCDPLRGMKQICSNFAPRQISTSELNARRREEPPTPVIATQSGDSQP